ncbi:hypothetical protein [Pontibacter sp. G13]|uniref:hypothetical protein n=1 Tax=Pontibacter sp. G13 TaxID=3074898 RepID=UPI00288C5C34|nr:hypothetical protein [Pontibacter sp. G13]WNJ20588.1 hypothetical protein RJD25_08900 [Pontibacter sp. G13]
MFRQIIYCTMLGLMLWGCANEDPAFIDPEAAFSLDKEQYQVFETLALTNQGEGQFYAVFTGDPGHDYDQRESGDTGFKTDVNGNFSYSYSRAGTYTITMVASGYALDSEERVEAIAQKEITITDPNIDAVNFTQFEVGNSATANNRFLDPITFLFKDFRNTADIIDNENRMIGVSYYRPTRLGEIAVGRFIPFSTVADINVIPTIELNTNSETVEVLPAGTESFVNGQTRIIFDTEDDLRFQEKAFVLTNSENQTSTYWVCPMIIPEFTQLTIGGQAGTLELYAGDYNQFDVFMDLPDGTDLTQLIPEWDLYDAEHTEVRVNGNLVESGISALDFTEPLIFELTYTQPKTANAPYSGIFSVKSQVVVHVE